MYNLNLDSYIKIYENVLSPEHCQYIINTYHDSDLWKKSWVNQNGEEKEDLSERDCDIIDITKTKKTILGGGIIDDLIFNKCNKLLNEYANEFKYSGDSNKDVGYSILRYNKGNKFKQHTDDYDGQRRVLSLSIALNDDYDGGEWGFWDRQKKFKLKTGDALIFPSNFLYPHEILPIKSGVRYSVLTWFY